MQFFFHAQTNAINSDYYAYEVQAYKFEIRVAMVRKTKKKAIKNTIYIYIAVCASII